MFEEEILEPTDWYGPRKLDASNPHISVYLKPVVQFSCASFPTPAEDALEADLQGNDDEKRLAALKKLVEVSAPSSVPLQYAAFLDLKKKYPEYESITFAAEAFDPEGIAVALSLDPPRDEFSSDRVSFYWNIRAAGVLKLHTLLPRLLELSAAENLDTTLAAERSIEDFDGVEAEDALLRVVSLWKCNAFEHAADAMLKRNPDRLSREVEAMSPPEGSRYRYGLILAGCGNVKAVPHLCATVKKMAIIDKKMFEYIAKLGTAADREIIVDLPSHVRPDQVAMAQKCVDDFLTRIEGNADASKREQQ